MTRAPRVARTTGALKSNRNSQNGKDTNSPKDTTNADNDEVSIKQFIIFQLRKFFIDHIPMESLKELPPQCKSYYALLDYSIGLQSTHI